MPLVITHATVAGDPQTPLLDDGDWNAEHTIVGLDELLDAKADITTVVLKSDYSPSHSILIQQSGTGSPTALQVSNNTLVGRLSGGGSEINDLSASDVRTLLSISNVDNTSDASKPISTATQTALNAKLDDTQFDGLAKITVGTTAPTAPNTGDLWIDTN